MIYYTISEILSGILYSLFFGVLLCVLSLGLDVLFSFLKSITDLPKKVAEYSKSRSSAIEYCKSKISPLHTDKKIVTFVKDVTFCVFFGVLLSFLFYVAQDGEKRIYLLASFSAFYILCKKLIGTRITSVIQILMRIIIKSVTLILIFALIPLRYIANKTVFILKKSSKKLGSKIAKSGKRKSTKTKLCKIVKKSMQR